MFVVIPRNYGDNSQFRIAVSDPRTGAHRALMPGFWARYVDPGYLLVVRPDSALVAVPFDAKTQQTTGSPIVLATDITVPVNGFPQIAVASTGQLVFATGAASGSRVRFARVHRDGTSAIVDSTWVGQARKLALSPDGVHAAAVVNRGTWDIQERDLRTGALSYVSVPATVANDPVFSSNGQSLIFIAGGPRREALRGGTGSASAAAHAVQRGGELDRPATSPDGRTLYMAAAAASSTSMRMRSTSLGRPTAQSSPRPHERSHRDRRPTDDGSPTSPTNRTRPRCTCAPQGRRAPSDGRSRPAADECLAGHAMGESCSSSLPTASWWPRCRAAPGSASACGGVCSR